MSEAPETPEAAEAEAQEYKPVSRWFLFFMLRTKQGIGVMDRLGKWKVTKPLAWVMLAITPFAAALALYVIAVELSALYFSPQSHEIISTVRTISPLANFLLPGINPYLPVSVWLAIVVAMVIHESAHGIVARSLGLKIKASGLLLLLFVPIGAFVEVDDKQMKETRSRNSLRVLGAGSGINFIFGVACVLLLIATAATMVPAARGAAIVGVVQPTASQASPAYVAGIQPGDFVTAIDGSPVTDLSVLHNGTFYVGEKVNVTIWHDGVTKVLPNIALTSYTTTTVNTQTNQTSSVTYPFLGVDEASYTTLQSVANTYANQYKTSPIAYLVEIPTFGASQYLVPFSNVLSPFYTSALGSWTPFVTSSLFWLFFVNFNLAIFNSLPIYPMDGGQEFETFLRGAGKGKISDELARRVTTGVTLAIFLMLFVVIAGPYLSGILSPA